MPSLTIPRMTALFCVGNQSGFRPRMDVDLIGNRFPGLSSTGKLAP